jgi:hypothetical protein
VEHQVVQCSEQANDGAEEIAGTEGEQKNN